MIAVLCGLLAVIIVAVVVVTALMGWGDKVTRYQRIGLCVMASGLILAAPSRYMQGVGLADLMFLSGIATTLIARHWRHILSRADALDGRKDGRLGFIHCRSNVPADHPNLKTNAQRSRRK